METKYGRRQNTSWGKVEIIRRIREAEALMSRELDSFRSTEDLKSLHGAIDVWLNRTAHQLRLIFPDASIAHQYCRRVGDIDVYASSRLELVNSLKAAIALRICGLQILMNKTNW
jgi:hypothetical protein